MQLNQRGAPQEGLADTQGADLLKAKPRLQDIINPKEPGGSFYMSIINVCFPAELVNVSVIGMTLPNDLFVNIFIIELYQGIY